MIYTGYPVSQFNKIGYKGFSHNYPVNNTKFTLKVTQNENLSTSDSNNVEDIISKLESGNKDAINTLESLGLNYSLTEYKNGYKVKFEQDGNKYTVAYNGEFVNADTQSAAVDEKVFEEKTQVVENEQQKIEEFNPPLPPKTQDYLKITTYSNGMKETCVDEKAYEAALQDYLVQKAEYDSKIQEKNQQIAEQQKQDIINNMQEEWDSFSQSIKDLQTEMDTNGTNSKMMTSVMHELSAEYAELIQRKMETKIKNIDKVTQNRNASIPNPPSASFYETDEEYAEAMNNYTYQKFLYEKQQKELELKIRLSEKRIEKIDKKLEEIRKLLFGTTT